MHCHNYLALIVSCFVVLVTRHIWLLSTAPSDHDWLGDKLFPLTKTELEPHKQISCVLATH